MPTQTQSASTSSLCKLFVLTLTLLLASVSVVNAQDNTNVANGNAGGANVSANRNANTNASANTSANTNTNARASTNTNQSSNGNGNVNGSSNQEGISAAETRRNALAGSQAFFFLVTLLFAILLIPFAMTIVRAIRFSKETFRSPLGMPEGSLRAILAYTLIAFVGFYVYASILSFSVFEPPQFLLGIVATVIGFYFGSRTGEDRGAVGGAGATRVGDVRGTVVDKNGTAAVGASVELSQSGVRKLTHSCYAAGTGGFHLTAKHAALTHFFAELPQPLKPDILELRSARSDKPAHFPEQSSLSSRKAKFPLRNMSYSDCRCQRQV